VIFNLETPDIVIIALYFVVVFYVAWWATKREKSESASNDYFLAGRNLGWFVIGASLFASNIGSEHLIGLAGSGFSEGVPVAQYEILAGIMLLMLGWVFVPFYLRSNVSTMPEFLEQRYDSKSRMYLSIVSVIAYVLTKISVTIYAGGVVFEAIGMNFWFGAILLVIATGVYTVFGGLKAVVYTDMIQMFVLLGGSLTVTFFGLQMLGGWSEVVNTAPKEFFSLWRPATDTNYPWTGILFGAPILGVWYWCTDQFIVQRVLSAKNLDQARKGTVFAGYLKMLPLFLFVLPGIIAYALVQKGLMHIDAPDKTLPTMVATVLPVGMRGLVVAGLFAALMSSLSSVFNSCSTLITLDLYKKMRPNATERQLVTIGQGATILLVGFGLLWIPFMKYFSNQLFLYLQSVQAYISPPIAAVFLFGIFWKRLNSKGAIASLVTGLVLGMIRFGAELMKDQLTGFMRYVAEINFLHFAIILFGICTAVLVLVSLASERPDPEKIKNITYQPGASDGITKQPTFWYSLLLGAFILFLWWYLS